MSTFFLRPSRLKVSKLSQGVTLFWTFPSEMQPDNVTRQYVYIESCQYNVLRSYETYMKFQFRSTTHSASCADICS